MSQHNNHGGPKIITLDRPVAPHAGHVVIAVLCMDQMQSDFAMALAAMTLNMRAGGLISLKNSLIPSGRNMAVDGARKLGAEWILFLDSDMTFPIGTLNHLLARGRDIVGVTYPKRIPPHELNYKLLPGVDRVEASTGLIEVAGLPAGCLLINMRVFESMPEPYFQTPAFTFDAERRIVEAVTGGPVPAFLEHYVNPTFLPGLVGEDYFFCAQARALGFKVWLDVELSQRIGHIGQNIWYAEGETEQEEHGKPTVGVTKTIN